MGVHPIRSGRPVASMRLASALLGLIVAGSGAAQSECPNVAARTAGGGHWQRLTHLVEKSEPMSVMLNQCDYADGERMTVTIDVPEAGHLTLVAVDSQGSRAVLFPNIKQKHNRVPVGVTRVPKERVSDESTVFHFEMGPPYGLQLVVAIITNRDVDLFGEEQRAGGGLTVHAGMVITRVCSGECP